MKKINRSRLLKRMGCVQYKNGKSYIDKKKLDLVTGYNSIFKK